MSDCPTTIIATRGRRAARAFTLVEILIVVMILGILAAAVVIPALAQYTLDTKASAFVTNLRQFARSFEVHEQQFGTFPPDEAPGVFPPEMAGEIDDVAWAAPTPVGGSWEWDYGQYGVTAGISVHQPSGTDAQMTDVDRLIDDGDLATGAFQRRVDGFIWIISQ